MVVKNNEYYRSWGVEFSIDYKSKYVNIKLGRIILRMEVKK